MPDHYQDKYLLESGAPDGILLEDGSGVLVLEVPSIRFSNLMSPDAGDGISVTEKAGFR